jgi:hypothetical protein
MKTTFDPARIWRTFISLVLLGVLLSGANAWAQTATPVRLRGSIESFDATSISVRERSGELVVLQLPAKYTFQEVLPIEISAIAPNSFIGTAAVPGKDGTWQALEVVVFPETARGTGEGHYPWDLKPESTMTNATVADLVRTADARRLTLRYKDGEKLVVVPDGVPVVTFRPGESSLVKAGARVFIVATLVDGKPTVSRLVIGRDGFAPPM